MTPTSMLRKKRKRPKGSTSVDIASSTRQELRGIIRRACKNGNSIPMTRTVALVVRKFCRLQELSDQRGFLRIGESTFDLNLD